MTLHLSPELSTAFAGLPSPLLERIAGIAVPCRYWAHQTIFRAGEKAEGLYVVLTGRVRVSRETRDHIELLHIETAGGLLGEIPVFGGGSFPATAVAATPVFCAKLPSAAIERLLSKYPEFGRFALRRLALRAQSLLRRIDELTATTITARLARHVLERSENGLSFTLGMSQAALADDFGTAREVLVRSLASLVRLEAIRRTGRSRFTIINRELLESIAGRSVV